jgi:type II secretory pathway pseudopilin PulG
MKLRSSQRQQAAYTLVELLIVVAIIIILSAMLLTGVQRVLSLGARTETLHEIKKLEQALQVAMAKYNNIPYLPSRLVLHNDINVYRTSTDPIVQQTANVLRSMFGKRFISNGTTVNWGGFTGNLNGAQCLVFYLGGMNGTDGFSDNPTNPTLPGGTRIGPFYQFRSNRLTPQPGYATPLMYLDPYGTPYAYFGATSKNVYNLADCVDLGVQPYLEGANRFLNPNTFQIISAGKNKVFGPGGPIDLNNGVANEAGADDLSNFSSTELGNPVQ